MNREELLKKEEKSYREYLNDLHTRNPPGSLSHFEHNLEVRNILRTLYTPFINAFEGGGSLEVSDQLVMGVLYCVSRTFNFDG
jgi:hypothetical protein